MDERQIKDFSIKNKIPIDDTKKILDWYDLNKKYVSMSNDLRNKEIAFVEFTNKIDNINNNFMVKFMEIKENESVKNKKKKYSKLKLKK